jgi:hypothetical protein
VSRVSRGAHDPKGRSVTQRSFIGYWAAVTFAAGVFALVATMAQAQTTVRIGKQFGIAYLPLTIMEQKQVLEAHGRRRGLDLKPEWMQFASGARMNEAILAGNLDLASGGIGPFMIIWGKTRGNIGVKGVAALNSMPLYLNTINPKVKSIRDFSDNDRIALPARKPRSRRSRFRWRRKRTLDADCSLAQGAAARRRRWPRERPTVRHVRTSRRPARW